MAVLWAKKVGGNLYEVRSAGASVRLYRNGVNHSQWNPNQPLNGSVWDLLVLPSLHREPGSLQSAAVVGFGAGAAGRLLRDLARVKRVVGVDWDKVHLSIAKRFFKCAKGCELVAGDAVKWVQSERDSVYDYIIDDLYAEDEGGAARFAPMDSEWCFRLVRLLRPGGILVFNTIYPDQVLDFPMVVNAKLRRLFPYAIGLQLEGYDNRILAFSDQPFPPDILERNLRFIGKQFPRSRDVKSRYEFCRV